jgi:transposase-like protein
MANSKRYGSPTDYPPEACNHVVALMGTGLSLTAAAAAMGVSPETIKRWIDAHEEFKDAVSRGKAARVLILERQMLASKDSAVISACRFALLNAAPEEWRVKPVVDSGETVEDPVRVLAKQISGNAIRPRMPESKVMEHEPVAPRALQPQQDVIIEDEVDHVVPRIHTI